MKRFVTACVGLLMLTLTGCGSQLGGPDTTYTLGVLWNHHVYESYPNDHVSKVGKQLGTVQKRINNVLPSDSNATVSNEYPVGTKIYAVLGKEPSKVIAVETPQGKYVEIKVGS